MGEIKRSEQDTQEYKDWRASVYKRDKHRCVCCNKKSYLNAHHLNGWNWCIESRYDVNNGVTLCWKCHRDFHRQYGRGYNYVFQFEAFLAGFGRTLGEIL